MDAAEADEACADTRSGIGERRAGFHRQDSITSAQQLPLL